MELTTYCSPEFEKCFRLYGASEHKASRTINEYTSYINMICDYSRKDFLDLGLEDGQTYINHLTGLYHSGSLSRKTIKVRLSCYKSLGNYIEESGKVDGYENPFAMIRNPEVDDDHINTTKVPTINEVDAVLSAAKRDSLMSYLIIALAVRVGLSASSILKIRHQSFLQSDGSLILCINKRSDTEKEIFIPLPEDIKALIENYLSTIVPDESGHIFFNQRKHPLSMRNLDTLIKNVIADSGIDKKYSLKDFRTRAILDMTNAGVSAQTLGDYTGLKGLRLQSFMKAKDLVGKGCPADLTNIHIVS